jgi:hypothetical protein
MNATMNKMMLMIISVILTTFIGCSYSPTTTTTTSASALSAPTVSPSCNIIQSDEKNKPAEQVVSEHFKYWNDKDLAKLEETMTPNRKGISWEFDKLESVRLLSIVEKKSDEPNERVFIVEFEIKFKNGEGSGLSDGKYTNFAVMLRRETESSPWLIYDWGY